MEYNRNSRFNFVGKGSDGSGVGVGKLTVTRVARPLQETSFFVEDGFLTSSQFSSL